MTLVWPITLPKQPLIEGLSGEAIPNYSDFQPSEGATYRIRKGSRGLDSVVFIFEVTGQQLRTFLNFYRNEAADGVTDFDVHSMRDNLGANKTWTLMWAKPDPTYPRVGHDRYRLSFGCEMLAPDEY